MPLGAFAATPSPFATAPIQVRRAGDALAGCPASPTASQTQTRQRAVFHSCACTTLPVGGPATRARTGCPRPAAALDLRSDAQVADALLGPTLPFCLFIFFGFDPLASQKHNCKPSETELCHTSRAPYGCTPG